IVGQYFAENPRRPMVERAHGVEGMGCVPSSGLDPPPRLFESGIGMPNADADATFASFCNHFLRAIELGSNRDHAHMAAGRLPELVKSRDARLDQIDRRMDA